MDNPGHYDEYPELTRLDKALDKLATPTPLADAIAEREALRQMADDMRAEQTYLGSCRETCDNSGRIRWDRVQRVIDYFDRAALAATEATDAKQRDVKQLADWLLTDPQTGQRLTFAGPLERDFLGMSRVKMASSCDGNVWTLTAGLKEGYRTTEERVANMRRIAAEERESAREPSLEQLTEMAYLLELVPRGEVVCVQFMDVLRKQYRAAMEASGV